MRGNLSISWETFNLPRESLRKTGLPLSSEDCYVWVYCPKLHGHSAAGRRRRPVKGEREERWREQGAFKMLLSNWVNELWSPPCPGLPVMWNNKLHCLKRSESGFLSLVTKSILIVKSYKRKGKHLKRSFYSVPKPPKNGRVVSASYSSLSGTSPTRPSLFLMWCFFLFVVSSIFTVFKTSIYLMRI